VRVERIGIREGVAAEPSRSRANSIPSPRDCELKSLGTVPYRSDWNAVSTQAFSRVDGSGGVAAESGQSRVL